MVVSLYIFEYFKWLRNKYQEELIDIEPELFFVPDNSADSMTDHLVRTALGNRSPMPGIQMPQNTKTWFGFNRGVLNKDTLRPNTAVRFNTELGKATKRKMVRGAFPVSMFFVSTNPEHIEDIEEIYNTTIRSISSIEIDMGLIFEQNYSEWRLNTFHGEVMESTPLENKGNLWGLQIEALISGPIFSLTREEREKAKRVSICLYNNNIMQGKVEVLRTYELPV